MRGGQGRGGGGGWGLTIRCQVCIPCLQVLLLVYVFAFCYCFGMGSNELIHSDAFTFSALNCSSKTPALTHWTLINRNIFIWGVDWFWGGWLGGGGGAFILEGRTTLVALTLVQSSSFVFVFGFGHSVIACNLAVIHFLLMECTVWGHKWWNTGIKHLWATTELFLKFVAWICQWWI